MLLSAILLLLLICHRNAAFIKFFVFHVLKRVNQSLLLTWYGTSFPRKFRLVASKSNHQQFKTTVGVMPPTFRAHEGNWALRRLLPVSYAAHDRELLTILPW